MKLSTIAYLGLSTLLLGLMPTPAIAVTIDLFSEVQAPITQTGTGSQQSSVTAALESSIIGLERESKVEVISGTRSALLEVNNGIAILETGNQTKSRATFTWDGINSAGLGGKNLTLGGHNSFKLDIGYIDQSVDLIFEVKDTSGNTGSIIKSNISSVGSVFFNYGTVTNNSVNFSSVDSISLRTNNEPPSLDFEFLLAETAREVPFEFSPSLGIIMCGSFFGFRAIRKRLKTT